MAIEPMTVAVTHALLAGRARELLCTLPLARLVAADTVTIEPPVVSHFAVISVTSLIATVVRRDHRDESLADLWTPA